MITNQEQEKRKENSEVGFNKEATGQEPIILQLRVLPCFSLLIIDFRKKNGLDEIDICCLETFSGICK